MRAERRAIVSRRVLAVLLFALALFAALAPTALAALPSNPLQPGLPAGPAQTQTATAPPIALNTSTSPTDSGLSGPGAIAIALGAMLVLGGISLFIWRDARRRAPIRHRAAAATAGDAGRVGSKPRSKPRKLSPAERRRRKRGRAR